ncbi:Sas10 C-terminal domain-containing protein [Dipodascopsis tothii]|uniref:Sas10 C-terminal domain-containing protein n=1 Tax=Dipodascopsis tothii TaxID=44089 RepID=UPI0034CDA2A9
MARRGKSAPRKAPANDTADKFGLDEVDEFHEGREKIMLESGKPSRYDEDEEDVSDREVLAVNEAGASSESEDLDEDDYDEDDLEDEDLDELEDEDDEVAAAPTRKTKGQAGRGLQAADVDDDDDDWRQVKNKYVEEDHLTGWGKKAKAYYNADEAEDEEDAIEEEEAAIEIQKKALAEMDAEDFLDDFAEDTTKGGLVDESTDLKKVVKEKLPEINVDSLSAEEKLKLLQVRNPEFMLIAKEYDGLVDEYEALKASGELETSKRKKVAFVALSAYISCICVYLTLFTSSQADTTSLKDHKIMEKLLILREYYKKIATAEESDDESEVETSPELTYSDEDEEDEAEDDEAEDDEGESFGAALAAPKPLKRKRDAKSLNVDDELDLDLDLSVAQLSKRKKLATRARAALDDDFADATALDDVDLADKAAKRRSLRFYTSKIDQKTRGRKTLERFAGDEDLPYREREKERQARMTALAELRGKTAARAGDADFLGGDDDDYDDMPGVKAVPVADADLDYYNEVKASKDKKVADKAQMTREINAYMRSGKIAKDETVGVDGKRAINYQILKNKGLTPKRNKDNRNSRVKKRKKYEKAKKKLASMKAVYKAPQTAYGGEKTGIKKNLSRSVKFK